MSAEPAAATDTEHAREIPDELQEQLQRRLSRAEGQLAGIRRMVEEDAYCVDILVQIAAVRGALGRVGQLLLSSHIEHCVATAFRSGDPEESERQVDELMEVFSRYGGLPTK